MKDTLSKVVLFAAGATVGSLVTWKLLKTKYELIAQEEITSVKEMYLKKDQKKEYEPVCAVDENEGDDNWEDAFDSLHEIIDTEGYTSDSEKTEKGGSTSMEELITVIPPEEVGEKEEYDVITLFYFADGVLTDEKEKIVECPEDIIGYDALNSFGEYEDDSVFVQNDERKCYYEILLDTRTYSGITDLMGEFNER